MIILNTINHTFYKKSGASFKTLRVIRMQPKKGFMKSYIMKLYSKSQRSDKYNNQIYFI